MPSSSVSITEQLKPKFFCYKNTHHTCIGGSKYETHKNLTNKFNTHFAKTHYNQTLQHNERGSNVHFFFTEWRMLQCCYFWRGMKTYFSSLLMMLISSQSKTCKWNVWTQLSKLFYGGGKGSLGQSVCKRETAHNLLLLLTLY